MKLVCPRCVHNLVSHIYWFHKPVSPQCWIEKGVHNFTMETCFNTGLVFHCLFLYMAFVLFGYRGYRFLWYRGYRYCVSTRRILTLCSRHCVCTPRIPWWYIALVLRGCRGYGYSQCAEVPINIENEIAWESWEQAYRKHRNLCHNNTLHFFKTLQMKLLTWPRHHWKQHLALFQDPADESFWLDQDTTGNFSTTTPCTFSSLCRWKL